MQGKIQASYTVEASYIMSIVILSLADPCRIWSISGQDIVIFDE